MAKKKKKTAKKAKRAGLTVVELTIDSYKRVRAAHVKPTPTGLVLVRGKNAAGKSTVIESMLDVLGIEKSALPITEGEHAGNVNVRLSNGNPDEDLIVEEKITRDDGGKAKRALSITAADGSKIKGPAGVLKSLRGHFADPVAFLDMAAADQVKAVLAVTGLDEELESLEGIALGQYERRRDLGRDADRLTKALWEIRSEVEGLPAPPDEGSIEDLTAELTAAKDHNAEIDQHLARIASVDARGSEAAARLELLRTEVEKLEGELAAHRSTRELAAEKVKGSVRIDTDPIVEKLTAFEEVAKHAARRELLESTRASHAEAAALHVKIGDSLDETRQAIDDLLDKADFPDPDMSYDSSEKMLKINGIPFAQASQAERLKAAASVAMAGDPAIRVMFAREGSLLDEESRLQLADLAEKAGFQLWLEVVDDKAEGTGIWIEDGEAFQ